MRRCRIQNHTVMVLIFMSVMLFTVDAVGPLASFRLPVRACTQTGLRARKTILPQRRSRRTDESGATMKDMKSIDGE